jgi:hypothetical protein
MSSDEVFCKDCRFAKKRLLSLFAASWEYARCMHTQAEKNKEDREYLVSGKRKKIDFENQEFCTTQRLEFGSKSTCGKEGKNFEPKNEKERKIYQVNKELSR